MKKTKDVIEVTEDAQGFLWVETEDLDPIIKSLYKLGDPKPVFVRGPNGSVRPVAVVISIEAYCEFILHKAYDKKCTCQKKNPDDTNDPIVVKDW